MNILDKIILNKKRELKKIKSSSQKFKKIFSKKEANIIWEIKLASPKFDYSDKIDMKQVFDFYWNSKNIKAVSILIDEKYFFWDIERGYNFKKKYEKPIFFKEFIISKKQIDWASYFWYDWLLLLKRILNTEKIKEFIEYSLKKDIFPIVEVDNEKDLEKVLKIDLDFWIWINCRNLWTMEIDRNRHFEIYEKYKEKLEKRLVFAFSWIDNLEQVGEYKWKYNGVLIGTYFMKKLWRRTYLYHHPSPILYRKEGRNNLIS